MKETRVPASLFQSAAWHDVLRAAYGFEVTFVDDDEGRSLPLVLTERALAPRVVSLPFSDYVDTHAWSPDAFADLLGRVRERFPAHPLIVKTTFAPGELPLGEVTREACVHRVDTSDGTGLEEPMRSSFLRGVRKAERAGIALRRSQTREALQRFYQLHAALRLRKFGSIPQPRRFFDAVYDGFLETGRGFILEAAYEEQTVASLIALKAGGLLYYKFGASDADHLDLRPNNLLFHRLVHLAHEEGCAALDLGLSGSGAAYDGLRRFKASFGGRPHPITWFRVDPPGYDRAREREFFSLLSGLTDALVEHAADPATLEAVSNQIYPYFA